MSRRPPKKRNRQNVAAWIPGVAAGEPSPAELVAEFLLCTEHLSDEATAKLAGIGTPTLRKWKRGLFRNVSLTARHRIRMYLAKRAIAAAGTQGLRLQGGAERATEREGVLKTAV